MQGFSYHAQFLRKNLPAHIRQSGSTESCVALSLSTLYSFLLLLLLLLLLSFHLGLLGPRANGNITLVAPAASHIDGSGSPYPGLCWIIALLCFIISLHLYFYKIGYLFTLIFSVLLLFILCVLVSSRSCGLGTTWQCFGLLSRPLGSTHYVYQIFCQCNLYIAILLFCSVCDTSYMSVCPGRGIPSPWLSLRFRQFFPPC